MRPRRLSAAAIGLVGLLVLLEWSGARALSSRHLPSDAACQKLGKLITTLPPPEGPIFDTAAALTPEQMGPTVAWLHDVISETASFLQQARAEALLEGAGSKEKLAKIDEAIHVIGDILLPAFNENHAQLSGEIAVYSSGQDRSEQQRARMQTQFFLCIHRTLLCMQVARESGTGLNFDEKTVLKKATGNSSTEQDTDPANRPGGFGGRGGTDPGGGMDPGVRPPEASPFI